MVERFNGRIQQEVLGSTVASYLDLDTLVHSFNQAYDARHQRMLKGRSPETFVRERLNAVPATAVATRRLIDAACPRLFRSLPAPRTPRIHITSPHRGGIGDSL
jgi:hypothetical protein